MPILAQYIANIVPMFLHAEILAQYCIQYWRNIAKGYVFLYCTNIRDNIGALLAIILRQYW